MRAHLSDTTWKLSLKNSRGRKTGTVKTEEKGAAAFSKILFNILLPCCSPPGNSAHRCLWGGSWPGQSGHLPQAAVDLLLHPESLGHIQTEFSRSSEGRAGDDSESWTQVWYLDSDPHAGTRGWGWTELPHRDCLRWESERCDSSSLSLNPSSLQKPAHKTVHINMVSRQSSND